MADLVLVGGVRHTLPCPLHGCMRCFASLAWLSLLRVAPQAQGGGVEMALRARVFPFPEGMCAVWVMLAVVYFPAADKPKDWQH